MTTIEELTKHKYLKREVNGPNVCSKESFRADPAVGENNHACSYVCQCFVFHFILSPMLIIFVYHYSGHDKQCLCSLAEEPYPALCAPVNSDGVRVAIGFYGMTRYLHI